MFHEISASQTDPLPSQIVFGEALETQGKTLIPVSQHAENRLLKGVFKGLFSARKPLGFLEVSSDKTRYIRANDRQKIGWIVLLAVVSFCLIVAGLKLRKTQRAKRVSLW